MIYSTHPDPLMERAGWRDLNGPWRFAFDDAQAWTCPRHVTFDREIVVPYPPESERSGVGDEGFHPVAWYGRQVTLHAHERGGRLLLHFGAVDYAAQVWVNGQLVAEHEGGHTPFSADITDALDGAGQFEVVVRASDDPFDLAKPRGKQDWQEKPHSIWYPRTTGIWQTVWLECVPAQHIAHLAWTPHMDRWEIGLDVELSSGVLSAGAPSAGPLELRVRLSHDGRLLADDRYSVLGQEVSRRIALPDPGIDDFRNELLWSPDHPNLIQAEVELWEGGVRVDRVLSYTALRVVGVRGPRFMLNGRPYYLRLVLDQGYRRDALMSATDAELRQDVELIKRLGFNGARKHQKIEDPRYLYWADVLGLLVWEELPSAYRFTPTAVQRLSREWTSAIRRDASHPCIVAWVPINESWGVPDLPTNPAHRDLVRALYALTKTLDPTRPVIGNDGWEQVETDLISVHDYTDSPAVILERYGSVEAARLTVERAQPAGRALTLEGFRAGDHPIILSEFGGVAYIRPQDHEEGWGYSESGSAGGFLNAYQALLEAVHESRGLAGFCYTQLTDTFQEKNGLLFEDRSPKADLSALAQATQGKYTNREAAIDPALNPYGYSPRWRERRPALAAGVSADVSSQVGNAIGSEVGSEP